MKYKSPLQLSLSTVDQNGNLLESGGMVYISAEPKQPINPDFPITVKIPFRQANPAMKVFRLLDDKNPSAGWIENEALFDRLYEFVRASEAFPGGSN